MEKFKCKARYLMYLFAAFVISSCSLEEEVIREQHSKAHFTVKKVAKKTFSKNHKLVDKLNKTKSIMNKNSSKIVSSSNSDFTVNTNTATLIEFEDGQHSYTFHLNRNVNNNLLENLILSSQGNGTYKSYIITYDLTPTEINNLKNGLYIDTTNRFIMTILEDDALETNLLNKIVYTPCVVGTTTMWVCDNGVIGHRFGVPGPPTCVATSFSYIIRAEWGLCATDDGTTDVNLGDGSGSTQGGGGTSTPTEPDYDGSDPNIHGEQNVNTLPTFDEDITEDEDPCTKLIQLYNPQKADAKTVFSDLAETIVSGFDGENAVTFKRNSGDNYGNQNVTATNTNSISGRIGGNVYGECHTHPLNTYPMFSWTDVKRLLDIKQNALPHNVNYIFNSVVVKDDSGDTQVYALVFNDDSFGASTLEDLLNQPELNGCSTREKLDIYDEELREKFEDDSSSNYERAFLRQFYGFNISLYKANSDLTNWSRLQINTITGSVVETPCN